MSFFAGNAIVGIFQVVSLCFLAIKATQG